MAIRTTRPRFRAPAKGYILSRANVGALFGGKEASLLAPLTLRDSLFFFDDFLGDTVNLDNYLLTTGGGTMSTTGVAFASSVVQNGAIVGTTGTTANDSMSISRPAFYSGQQNPYFEVALKITSTTTNTNIEVGFIDALQASGVSALTDVDTASWASTNAAVISVDTAQTIATMVTASVGAGSGQTSQITTLTTAVSPIISLTQTSTITLGVELLHMPGATGAATAIAQAAFYVNGVRVAIHGDDADGAVDASALLLPYVLVRTRTGAAKTSAIDYWLEIADRA